MREEKGWGQSPWVIDFVPAERAIPSDVDVAIVGGGFTGLSAAAWLKRIAPKKSVVVFEAETIGSGASGRTGGMALAETAGGDLPGLGNVLSGFSGTLNELAIDCDFRLTGAFELSRKKGLANAPIDWLDSGSLRVAGEVPGGTVDAGKLVSGLARSAEHAGAILVERAAVESIAFAEPVRLVVRGKEIRARQLLLALNASSLELAGLQDDAEPKFTMGIATAPVSEAQLEALGLAGRQPFYTVDLPYLWGRLLPDNGIVFGAGLVHVEDWRELGSLDVSKGQAAQLLTNLEKRVHALHPTLRDVKITHRWGGPILLTEEARPVFRRHESSRSAIVLCGYNGHGVALSVYLGRWGAEVFIGERELPDWSPAALLEYGARLRSQR